VPEATPWRSWNEEEWADALFRFLFVGDVASPLTLIPADSRDLATIVDAPPRDADEVSEAFVAAHRCSPYQIQRRLSLGALGRETTSRVPSCFGYLYLTCHVVASVESGVVGLRDFRKRLASLLHHHQEPNYPLEDLGILWEGFRDWLDERRARGYPYRPLLLPKRDWRTRIGYSINLAFPTVRDRTRLVRVIATEEIDCDATDSEVMRAVGASIDDFSQGFRDVFAEARRELVSAASPAPNLDRILTAVEYARLHTPPRRQSSGAQFKLLLQTNTEFESELVLLASKPPHEATSELVFKEVGSPFTDTKYLVAAQRRTGEYFGGILLSGALGRLLPDFSKSPVRRAVDEGVLLFVDATFGFKQLVSTRPTEGEILVLARDEPCRSLAKAVGRPDAVRKSQYTGWSELTIPSPAELSTLDWGAPRNLRGIKSLEPSLSGDRLVLTGGYRTEAGYLGFAGCLPSASAPEGSKVQLFGRLEGAGEPTVETDLLPRQDEEGTFSFAKSAAFDGRFRFVARLPDGRVLSKDVLFYSTGLAQNYRPPSDPSKWLSEGPTAALWTVEHLGELPLVPLSADRRASTPASLPTVKRPARRQSHTTGDSLRLLEVVSAAAARRAGLAEAEFHSLLVDVLGIKRGSTWEVARTWQEAGYLDVFSQRTWRARACFARPPQIVVDSSAGVLRATLCGSTPAALRARIEQGMKETGAVSVTSDQLNENVPPLLAWEADSIESVMRVAKKQAIEVRGLVEFDQLVVSVHEALHALGDVPAYYERRASWNWHINGFTPAASAERVSVDWLSRPDRPDIFVIKTPTAKWWTYSRNWALIAAYTDQQGPSFLANDDVLGRCVPARVYLPLPIARFLTIRSGEIPGSPKAEPYDLEYHYRCRDSNEASALISRLWSLETSQKAPYWPSLAARLSGKRFAVAMPVDIRNRLAGLGPAEASLASRPVSSALIPHLRQMVRKLSEKHK
jgi:hypothetical protein